MGARRTRLLAVAFCDRVAHLLPDDASRGWIEVARRYADRKAGRKDILVTGGGIIPAEDCDALTAQGIGKLFGPGTPLADLIDYINTWAADHLE